MKVLPILLILTASVFPYPVSAATRPKPIPAEFYSVIRKNLFMDEVLQSTDPATLSIEQVENAVAGAIAAGTVPQIGISQGEKGVYTFTTGLSGAAIGIIPVGRYAVSIDSIDGVAATAPKYITVTRSGKNELEIPMRYATLKDKVFDFIPDLPFGKPKATPVTIDATALVVVQLFRDTNNNLKRDSGEPDVPWANAVVTLTKISKERSIQLTNGANTVTFDRLPRNFQTALELITDIIAGGTSNITISSMTNGTPQTAIVRNGVTYGEDVPLQIKQPYIITVDTPSGIAVVQ